MTIINVNPNRIIQLGYEGEDKVIILRFSYSEKWLENGEGIFTVRVLRNSENQAYNAQVIEDDRENYTIDMTVTDVELSKKGYGEMQLVYTGADFVKKSPVYKYYVSRSVDEAVDPPESDVYTQIIESLSDLRTNFDELTNTVNEINDDIGDITELTTANKLNIVESINEVNSKSSVLVDDELSDVSTNPVQNNVITSRIISAESAIASTQTAIQGKADIQTVFALSDAINGLDSDVQGLQTGLAGKIEIPHTDEAKITIQKMLGIYEAPWELIREDTFTNAEEADHIITADVDGNAFELSDVIMMFETPKQSTEAKKQGYGQFWMYYGDGSSDYFAPACQSWTQNANTEARGTIAFVRQEDGIISFSCTNGNTSTNTSSLNYRWRTGFDGSAQSVQYTGNPVYIKRINIRAVTGTGHYRLYGKRKWQ